MNVKAPATNPTVAWAFLSRLMLATYPFCIAGVVWLVSGQFQDNAFRETGPRYTSLDAEVRDAKLRADIMEALSTLPPPDWRVRILAIEQLSRSNSIKLARILTLIESKKGGP